MDMLILVRREVKTIVEWYKKLKLGGILAGDDYHDDWPLVNWAVNDFASKLGVKISTTGERRRIILFVSNVVFKKKKKKFLLSQIWN